MENWNMEDDTTGQNARKSTTDQNTRRSTTDQNTRQSTTDQNTRKSTTDGKKEKDGEIIESWEKGVLRKGETLEERRLRKEKKRRKRKIRKKRQVGPEERERRRSSKVDSAPKRLSKDVSKQRRKSSNAVLEQGGTNRKSKDNLDGRGATRKSKDESEWMGENRKSKAVAFSKEQNKAMVKRVERQLSQDIKQIGPTGENKELLADAEKITKEKSRKKRRKKGKKSEHLKDSQLADEIEEIDETEPKSKLGESPPSRWDEVVATVILAQILACIAIIFEAYVYSLDQEWNQIVRGEKSFTDLPHQRLLQGKTLNFAKNEYLVKAKQYSLREEGQEILFLTLIVMFVGISIIHICTCYIRTPKVEDHAVLLILVYAIGGALCIYSSTFLIAAATAIENNYMYAADMMYNFQHFLDGSPYVENETDCTKIYLKGCDSYEAAKKQALHMETIFRICGHGSRYTRYYNKGSKPIESLTVFGGMTRKELKQLGFCSRDGLKLTAAIFAILAGIVSSIVPILFCCDNTDSSEEQEEETSKQMPEKGDTTADKSLRNDKTMDPGITSFVTSVEAEEDFDANAAIIDFQTFVEKASDDDEFDAYKYGREVFHFIRSSHDESRKSGSSRNRRSSSRNRKSSSRNRRSSSRRKSSRRSVSHPQEHRRHRSSRPASISNPNPESNPADQQQNNRPRSSRPNSR